MNDIEKGIKFLEIIDRNTAKDIKERGFEDVLLLKAMIYHEMGNLRGSLDYEKIPQIEYLAEEAYLLCKKCVGSFEEGVISLFRDTARKVFGASNGRKASALWNIIFEIRGKKGWDLSKYRKLKSLLEMDLRYNQERPQNCRLRKGIFQGGINTIEDVNDLDIEDLAYCEDIVFLPNGGRLFVLGDTHGDSKSVRKFIQQTHFKEDDYLVFLGDYVNNGLNSIGNLITVLELKHPDDLESRQGLPDPDKVILLSGNHEVGETYHTVLKEFFETHWSNATDPRKIVSGKEPPHHYGHIRLDLIRSFGVEKGEELYELFGRWGRNLPYIALCPNGAMVSHSIGLSSEFDRKAISFGALAKAKQDPRDIALLKALGYEAWKKQADTLHARMVNNENITPRLLDMFNRDLGVAVFVVGHRHYRSRDIHERGKMKWCDVKDEGRFVTICSSYERSREAGHYMENEFNWARKEKKEEGRKCRAKACYALFTGPKTASINRSNIKKIRWNVGSCHS